MLKEKFKEFLWKQFSEADGKRNVKVMTGPCRGVHLRVDFRTESAYWIGHYDQKVLRRIQSFIKPGNVAYDCGSFLGYYASAMRLSVGETGKVFAFEASNKNFTRIQTHIAMNNWENVECLHLAVGPDHSTIRFASEMGAASGPIDMPGKDYLQTNVIVEEVVCAGVDEIVYEKGLPAPDFIKLDLETAEIFALANGDRLWREKRPIILCELHKPQNPTESPLAFEAAEKFLKQYNYIAEEVHLGTSVKTVKDFIECESKGVQCTLLAFPK